MRGCRFFGFQPFSFQNRSSVPPIHPISGACAKEITGIARKMVSHEMDKGKRRAFSARMSVEAIVVVLVVCATVGIFMVKALADRWEGSSSPVSGKVTGLRHDAITATPSDRLSNVQQLSRADLEVSDGDGALPSQRSNETVVRNGVTVLSPPLLVPVINPDAIQAANGSEVLTSPRKAASARKRSHYATRARTHGHRRVARSVPFWRIVAR